MFIKYMKIITVLIIAAMVFGCAGNYGNTYLERETALDRNWGKSFEQAKHLQILNPDAGKNPDPVAGLGGQSEERIVKEYNAGGKTQKQSSSEIGVLTIKK